MEFWLDDGSLLDEVTVGCALGAGCGSGTGVEEGDGSAGGVDEGD